MTAWKRTAIFVAAALAWSVTAWPPAESIGASVFAERSSDAEGVWVTVQPRALAPGATVWEFDVAMNTHTRPLEADLARAAVLVDDAGHRYAPLSWKGDAPGGHHRRGILQFPAPGTKPKAVELQIEGIGATRSFKWQLD